MHFDVYEKMLLKHGVMLFILALHFDTSLSDLGLYLWPQGCEKVKISAPVISLSF